MRPVFNIFGLAAVRVSGDDVLPERGLLQREILQFVGDLYGFSIRPNLPPNVPPQLVPTMAFQQGQFQNEEGVFPIQQLVIFPDGDAVIAANTDVADMILSDYLDKLDTGLGYRCRGKPQKRSYVNNTVVEFDGTIDEFMPELNKISNMLDERIPRTGKPFSLKRLTFGFGDIAAGGLASLDLIEGADFTIEPRAGEPRDRHRYFSSAPTTTANHIQILETIERIMTVERSDAPAGTAGQIRGRHRLVRVRRAAKRE